MNYSKSGILSKIRGACVALVVLLAGSAYATESGNEHYPLGVLTATAAALPPPGDTELYNYDVYITGRQFNDNTGKSEIPGFKLDVFVEAPRIIHTWKFTWAGLNFSTGGAMNFIDTHLTVPGEGFHRFAVGDVNFIPLFVTRNTSKLHILFGPNIWAPIGDYNVDNPASAGLNYWTFAPEFGITYLPTPKWEVGAESFTQFNTRNNKTQYRSGDDTDIDYVIGYRPFEHIPKLQFAVHGYLYKQWTDDRQDGITVADHRGQVYAVGPQIRWDIIKHGGILVKWEHEMDVRNRPEGNRLWLEFAAPL